MSRRASKRARRIRDSRRAEYDAMREKQGYRRPGSLNPSKGGGGRSKRK